MNCKGVNKWYHIKASVIPCSVLLLQIHDEVIKWELCPRYKGQWCGALMSSLIWAWTTVELTIGTLVIWDAIVLIMTSICVRTTTAQITKFTGPTLGPPASCRPQWGHVGPINLAIRAIVGGVQVITYVWSHRTALLIHSLQRQFANHRWNWHMYVELHFKHKCTHLIIIHPCHIIT